MAKTLAAALLVTFFVFAAFLPIIPINDPTGYLQGAQSLAMGAPMWNEYDGAFVLWPPGYSFLIALVIKAGWTPLEGARVVNAIAAGVLFLLANALLRHSVPTPSLRWVGMFALIVNPLIVLALIPLSEMVFMAVQCALLLVLLHINESATLMRVALIGVLAGAGAMVRYVGLTGVLVAGIALALALPRRRWWLLVLYAVLALGPTIWWWMRNYALTGTLIGQRGGTARLDLVNNIAEMGGVLLTWLIYWMTLAALALALDRWRRYSGVSARLYWLWPLPTYAGLLLIVNIMFGSWSYLGGDNMRLLAGVYVPLLVWVLAAMSTLWLHSLVRLQQMGKG